MQMTPNSANAPQLTIDAAGKDSIALDGGEALLKADFVRSGDDLVIQSGDGGVTVLQDFFSGATPPDILTGGAVMPGRILARLSREAGDPAAGDGDLSSAGGDDTLIGGNEEDLLGAPRDSQEAALTGGDAGSESGREPVAEISEMEGAVTIQRADGTRVEGEPGTPLYEDDVIATVEDGSVGITFVDGMTFSLGEQARLLLEEFRYDATGGEGGGHEGGGRLSVLQGQFSFVSGNAAHTAEDALMIETPTMTIGVRGTKVVCQAAAEGETSRIALLAEEDGTVGKIMVTTNAGSELISEPNMMVEVSSRFQAPSAQTQISTDMVHDYFNSALSVLPAPAEFFRPDAPAGAEGAGEARGLSAGQAASNQTQAPASAASDGEAAAEARAGDSPVADAGRASVTRIESASSASPGPAAAAPEAAAPVSAAPDAASFSRLATLANAAPEATMVTNVSSTIKAPVASAAPRAVATVDAPRAAESTAPEAVSTAPRVATPLSNVTTAEDGAFSLDVSGTFTDPGDTMTLAATLPGGAALPAWLSFDPATATFTGTPDNADVGITSVAVTATDSGGQATTTTFQLTVSDVNDAPTLVGAIADAPAVQDSVLSYDVSGQFADVDGIHGDSLTFSATLVGGGALPGWLSIDPATGILGGTPLNADVGAIDVTVTATDGSGASVADDFQLSIANVNDAPVLVGAIADAPATEDSALSYDVSGNFADPDSAYGDSLTFSAELVGGAALPSWLSFDSSTGIFSGTPLNADVGAIDVNVTAIDGSGASTFGTFALTVSNENDIPTLVGAIADAPGIEDSALSYDVSGRFADVDGIHGDSLTFSAELVGGGPLPGWLSIDPITGVLSGTPLNADVGALNVKVTATDDDGASAFGAFQVNIANVNDAPTLVGAIADAAPSEDSAFSYDVSGQFADVDGIHGDSLTFSATLVGGGALPGWLSIDPASGILGGTPLNADVGAIDVIVTATDGSGLSASGSFQLGVANSNDAPTLTGAVADAPATEDAGFSYDISGQFADVDGIHGDSLSYSATLAGGAALPGWLSIDAVTGVLSGIPLNADVGAIDVTVTATDSAGASVADDFQLTVANTNDAPIVVLAIPDVEPTLGLLFSQDVSGYFADADLAHGDSLTFTAELSGGLPLLSWISIDAATGVVSGMPNILNLGTPVTIIVTATDSQGASVTDSFQLTVDSDNAAPVLSLAGSPSLTAIAEDSAAPAGNTVAEIVVDGSITDADGGAVEAIAVVGVDDSNGTWEFSTDGGASFSAVGAVSASSALLLDADDMLRFVPDADFNGTATFDYKAWDQYAGSSGDSGVDTLADTAYSAATETGSITVDPGNDAPLLDNAGSPALTAIAEDATGSAGNTVAEIVVDGSVSDIDGAVAEAIAVTSVDDSNGTWEYSIDGGANFAAVGPVTANSALLLDAAAKVRFVPDADYNGSASFGYKAWDGSTGASGDSGVNTALGTAFSAAGETAAITVNPVDDKPVLDTGGSPSLTAIDEDSAAPAGNTVAELVIDGSITDIDSAAVEAIAVVWANESGGTWEFSTDGGASFSGFGAVSSGSALLLDAAAVVRFVPDADFNGSANFGYKAWDGATGASGDSGVNTDLGGPAFSDATATALITVNAIADAPVLDNSGNPGLAAIAANTAAPAGDTVAQIVLDGSISDPDGAAPEAIAVTAVDDSNGTWEYSLDGGTSFTAIGAVSDASALLLDASAKVRFVPDADYAGTATFGFKAWDGVTGTRGDGGVDTTLGGTAFSAASEAATAQILPPPPASLDLASGSEILVNSTTAGKQAEASVTALAGGGHVVVWSSDGQDGDKTGVFGQRYDAAGDPAGAEFQINSTTAKEQDNPSSAGLDDGGFVVVWQSKDQDGDNLGVFGQRFDAAGDPAGAEFLVNTTTANKQEAPDVAALAGGGFVVTWESQNQDGGATGVYAQRYDSAGAPAGAEFQVNTETMSAQDTAKVAALVGGGFVVTWQSQNQDGETTGVYAQRYDASGVAAGGEFLVNSTTAREQEGPAIAALDDGGFIVAWQSKDQDGDNWGVFGQRFDASGAPVEFEFQINSNAVKEQSAPSVTALDDGGFLVAWQSKDQDGDKEGLFAQRLNADGDAVGNEFQVNTATAENQQGVDLATLDDGGVVAAWESNGQDGDGSGIYAHQYESDSASITVTPPVVGDYAIDLGAGNGFVDVADNGNQLDLQTRDLTVEAWFYYDSAVAGPQTIVSKGNADEGDQGYSIFLDNGELVVRVNASGAAGDSDTAASSVTLTGDPGWYHVALVIDQEAGADASSVTGYLNGSSAGWTAGYAGVADAAFTTASGGTDSDDSLMIGAVDSGAGSGNYFTDGQLSDVRVWNTARGAADIQADMSRLLNGDEANLVANWQLNDGSGGVAADTVAGGADGALSGGADWIESDSFSIEMDSALAGRVTAADAEGDSLSFSVQSGAANGTATIDAASGTWEYTPDNGFTGSDGFSYQVSDGAGGSDTVNISVVVTG